MSSNLRFLSERSLAVYEINMIEQWASVHRRENKMQAAKCLGLTSLFILLAILALIVPASLPNIGTLFLP